MHHVYLQNIYVKVKYQGHRTRSRSYRHKQIHTFEGGPRRLKANHVTNLLSKNTFSHHLSKPPQAPDSKNHCMQLSILKDKEYHSYEMMK